MTSPSTCSRSSEIDHDLFNDTLDEPAAPSSAAPPPASAASPWRRCSTRACFARRAAKPTAPTLARRRQPAALHAEGQARHLPVHGRRPVAPGDVRLQAEAGRDERQADAGVVHQGPADRPAPGREAELLRARSTRSRSAASRARRSATIFPHIGASRRRDLHRPLDAHRGDQPRPGPHLHEHRHDHLRPAEHGLVAAGTAWAARATTCPASSC